MSACAWNENAEQNIVTILPKGSNTSSCSGNSCSSSASSSGDSSSLSPGAVAGIAIAALVGVVILAAVLFFYIRRQRQKTAYRATSPEPDMSVLSGPVHNPLPPAPPYNPQAPSNSRFWSPDAVLSVNETSNGESSHSGITQEQITDEHGLELDGHGTEIKPVYHELADSEVGRTRSPPAVQSIYV